MKKRLTICGTIFAMCLWLLIPFGGAVYADSSSVKVTSKIEGTGASALNPGDKFYVDVSVSPVSACTFALNASWNTGDFELTDAVAGSGFYSGSSAPAVVYVPFYKSGGMTVPEQTVKDYESGNSEDVCVFAFAAGSDISYSGTVVTLEFTVKQDAENGLSEINIFFDEENPPKHFGSEHEGVDIAIAKGTDGKQNGGTAAEITGGQSINTGLANIEFVGSNGILEPEFSQSVKEYVFYVPQNESVVPQIKTVTTLGTEVEIDQATDFAANSTAVIKVHGKKTSIYKVNFIKQSKAAKPVIMPSAGGIERNTIISIMSSSPGKIYYTVDGSDPDISNDAKIYKGYFTPEQAGIPADAESFTVKAVSVEEGLEPSEIAEVKYKLPDRGAKASEITVNGVPIKNFNSDTPFCMYQISYEEWLRGNNIYEIEAFPLSSAAKIEYIPGNILSFDCNEGEVGTGDNKEVEIRIDTGSSFANYIIYFSVDNCRHTYWKEEETSPTCEEPGLYTLSCKICGKIYDSEIISEPLGHIPGDPVMTEAGCTDDGSITVTCQREGCGKEISREIIPASGHTPGEAVTIPASCGIPGSRIISCTVCGAEISKEILAPTGDHVWADNGDTQICIICGADPNNRIPSVQEHTHTYNGAEYVTEATCTTEGSRQVKCSFAGCESYITETIPMLQHTEVTESADPDCTTPGYVITKCNVCNSVISETTIDATGHSFMFENVLPDCTETIVLEAQCEICGETGLKTVDPVGHKGVWKADENGHCRMCSTCGELYDIDIHIEDQGVITREPAVGTKGIMTYYCSVCGYEMRTAAIPAILPGMDLPPQRSDIPGNPGGGYHEWDYKGEPAGNSELDPAFASGDSEDISVGAGIADLFASGSAAEKVKMVLAIVCVAGLFSGLAIFRKKRKDNDRNKMNF